MVGGVPTDYGGGQAVAPAAVGAGAWRGEGHPALARPLRPRPELAGHTLGRWRPRRWEVTGGALELAREGPVRRR